MIAIERGSERPAAFKRVQLWIFLVLLVLVVVAWRFLPLADWVERAAEPLRRAGAWGAIAYVIVYAGAVVLFVPGSAITLVGGYIYGPWLGTALVSAGSTLGAALAFLVGRTLLRERTKRWLDRDPRFAALDRSVAERGAWVVVWLRLSPVFPFNLLNYALGLTGIRFWPYVLVSWAGMLPGTIVYVLIGSSFGPRGRPGGLGPWYWAAVVAATLVATILLGRVARQALGDVAKREEQPS